jgi:hypothetical protein
VTDSRKVDWGGIHNARDLGGLSGSFGTTEFGRVYRMPRPDVLNERGWQELYDAGVRTLIDLRNDDEVVELPLRPSSIASLRHPIEDPHDETFMVEFGPFLGTPRYYAESLRRWPTLIAGALTAIADAPAGGVAFHCSAGRDRTGLIAALVLAVVGVDRELILDDYETGVREFNEYLRLQTSPREPVRSYTELVTAVAKYRRALAEMLGTIDLEDYLRDAGLKPSTLEKLRRRLLSA